MIYTHAAAALLAAALASWGTWQVQEWRHNAIEADRLENEREARVLRAKTADKAAASHEATREQLRTEFQIITREVDRVVEKPVYRDVCLDADGLRIVGRAIRGAAADPGEPAPALPDADRAD